MSKSSKDVSEINGADGLREKLKELVAPEIAERLVAIYAAAIDDFEEKLANAYSVAMTSGIDGCEAVGLAQADAGTPISTEALDCVMDMVAQDLLCMLLTLAGRVAAGAHVKGSMYVAHAMAHYENADVDQMRVDRENALKNLFGVILGPKPGAAPAPPGAEAN
jgi:hypothetical protein